MKKALALLLVITSATGLLIDFIMVAIEDSFLDSIMILKYFTIQSNLLVCIYFVLVLLGYDHKVRKFLGGITVYMFVTFIVFLVMLSPIWQPTGIRLVANVLLHYVIPFLTVLYVAIYKEEYNYQSKDIKIWMIYPFSYFGMVLILGVLNNDYIYPFLDVGEVGIFRFILVVIFLVFFFLLLSFILVKILSLSKLKRE